MNIKNIPFLLLQGVLVMTMLVAAPISANAAAAVDEKISATTEKVEEYLEDTAITTVVKGKYLAHKGLESMDISVETIDGVVTLTGVVDNIEQLALAEKLAQETKGVVRVVNSLTVKQ